tara:strand:+ start:141 stop:575 length:435 start_codon:yes stop_codon:yes gene_type:complete
MGLDGGGGGTILGAGDAFTGPAETLEIYGEHAAAYSGEIIVNNNTVSMFEFTTGNFLFVGTFSYGVDQNASLSGSKLIGFTIEMNGTKIFQQVTQTSVGIPVIDIDNNYNLIIPAYTQIKVESETTNTNNVPTYGVLTGRIYRG